MSVVTLEGHAFPSVLNIRVDGILRRYVPERTCRVVADGPDFFCSSCGFSADLEDWVESYSYCPGCGSNVVMPNDRP